MNEEMKLFLEVQVGGDKEKVGVSGRKPTPDQVPLHYNLYVSGS